MSDDLLQTATAKLSTVWKEIIAQSPRNWLDDVGLIEKIRISVNSSIKSYRYVLPTQVLAKSVNPRLDSRSIQVASGGPGSFDARSLCHKVLVPFDQENDGVLGGSAEPYVNNPLRVREITAEYKAQQKKKEDWEILCSILDEIERRNDKGFTDAVLRQILTEILKRLDDVRVVYPAPIRVNLDRTIELIDSFLSESSGGDRLLALTAALFTVAGRRFNLFNEVKRSNITAADAATGLLADLECVDSKGDVVIGVEVKDRALTINQLKSKIPNIRERKVSEVFFIAQDGIQPSDAADIDKVVRHEFSTGHNIYVTNIKALGQALLALMGEKGRIEFLQEVGNQLDKYRSDIRHRRAWSLLLRAI